LAEQYGLPTAQKKDSQGVCFLGKVDMQDFLSHYTESVPGDVLDIDGTVIGTHDGALFYTLGQRHGFLVRAQSPVAERLYVISKNIEQNTITVAPESYEVPVRDPQNIILVDTNWIGDDTVCEGVIVQARLRYRQKLFDVTCVVIGPGTVTVVPKLPQKYIPAGQSMVLYDGDRCLGGGVISE
jgi:tRNA-specific 2-thiouridylase